METESVKQQAHQLVEELPDGSCWEDLMHEIHVRQAIEAGLEDSRAGRTQDVAKSQIWASEVKVHWTDAAVEHLMAIR